MLDAFGADCPVFRRTTNQQAAAHGWQTTGLLADQEANRGERVDSAAGPGGDRLSAIHFELANGSQALNKPATQPQPSTMKLVLNVCVCECLQATEEFSESNSTFAVLTINESCTFPACRASSLLHAARFSRTLRLLFCLVFVAMITRPVARCIFTTLLARKLDAEASVKPAHQGSTNTRIHTAYRSLSLTFSSTPMPPGVAGTGQLPRPAAAASSAAMAGGPLALGPRWSLHVLPWKSVMSKRCLLHFIRIISAVFMAFRADGLGFG